MGASILIGPCIIATGVALLLLLHLHTKQEARLDKLEAAVFTPAPTQGAGQ